MRSSIVVNRKFQVTLRSCMRVGHTSISSWRFTQYVIHVSRSWKRTSSYSGTFITLVSCSEHISNSYYLLLNSGGLQQHSLKFSDVYPQQSWRFIRSNFCGPVPMMTAYACFVFSWAASISDMLPLTMISSIAWI